MERTGTEVGQMSVIQVASVKRNPITFLVTASLLLALFLVMVAPPSKASVALPPSTQVVGVYFDYFVMIVMENQDITSIYGPAAFMTSHANQYSIAHRFTAIDHPSEPNYLAMIGGLAGDCSNGGGATGGCMTGGGDSTSDCSPSSSCTMGANINLVDRFEAAGLSWKAYSEDVGTPCNGSNLYPGFGTVRHFPFYYFTDITGNASRCAKTFDATADFDTEVVSSLNSTSTAANFTYLSPNDCNNIHSCSVSTGDNYLRHVVSNILNTTIFTTKRAVLMVTFDEGDSTNYPTDYVYTAFSGPSARLNYSSYTQYTTYSILRTIEENWGLGPMQATDANAAGMGEFFTGGSAPPTPSAPTLTQNYSNPSTFASNASADFGSIYTDADNDTPSFIKITITNGTGRDPFTQPFSNDSIWNLPLGVSATYVDVNIAAATQTITDDRDIIILKPTATVNPVYFNDDGWTGASRCDRQGGVLFTAPIQTSFIVPGATPSDTPNNAVAIVAADGRTLYQGQPYTHCTANGDITMMWFITNDIYGTGFYGGHGGSQLSSIGGTIRLGELLPGAVIRHAMKLSLYGAVNYFYNATVPGFRWPATTADGYASSVYGGSDPNILLGSLLALPASLNISNMSLETTAAGIMAQAYKDYGAYLVDDAAWSVYELSAESGPDGTVESEVQGAYGFSMTPGNMNNAWARDIKKIMDNLSVINNWNLSNWQTVSASNGAQGAGGGAPRVAWADSLSSHTVTDTALGENNTADTNKSDGKAYHKTFSANTFQPGNYTYYFSTSDGSHSVVSASANFTVTGNGSSVPPPPPGPRYLVMGAAGCTASSVSTDVDCWSNTSGGVGGASVPGVNDTVILDSLSGSGTATLNADLTWSSLSTSGFTGTLALSTYTLTVGSILPHAGGNISIGSSTGNGLKVTGGTTMSGSAAILCVAACLTQFVGPFSVGSSGAYLDFGSGVWHFTAAVAIASTSGSWSQGTTTAYVTFDASAAQTIGGTGTKLIFPTTTLLGGSKTFTANFTTRSLYSNTTARTMTITAGMVWTINGSIAGQTGAVLSLRSSTIGSAWRFAPVGDNTTVATYVNVRDSNAAFMVNGTSTTNVDAGGNTNWFLPVPPSSPPPPFDSAGIITILTIGFGVIAVSVVVLAALTFTLGRLGGGGRRKDD